MARQSNLDTTKQDFLKEAYKKESKLRNKWFQGYFGSNSLPPGVSDSESPTSPMPATKAAKPTLIKIKPAPATPPERPLPPVQPAVSDPNVKMSEMRPASPGTKGMIYSGLSAEGDGRKAYLVKRRGQDPEEKFEYPLTSALEVGWNIKEVSKTADIRQAHFGKSRIIRDTFFAENGVM